MLVVKQAIELPVVNLRRGLLDFGINMAVGDKDIQPAVVVVIEKAASKTEYLVSRAGKAGLIADLVEEALAIVSNTSSVAVFRSVTYCSASRSAMRGPTSPV